LSNNCDQDRNLYPWAIRGLFDTYRNYGSTLDNPSVVQLIPRSEEK